MSWLVNVEWDGNIPPTTWYRRLHSLGLYVRGDKNKSPITRRAVNGTGVITQEGSIIVSSESLARAIALVAQRGITQVDRKTGETIRLKARAVAIGEINLTSKIEMTDEDRAALKRIEDVLGKRGRPDPECDWVVTCFEDMGAHQARASAAFNCPHCGGVRVRIRPGTLASYRDPGGDVFTAWLRLRFNRGYWEPTEVKAGGQEPPDSILMTDQSEGRVVDALQRSALASTIQSMGRDEAFRVLDAILIARAHWTPDRRLQARITAATKFFQAGGSPAAISLAETTTPDLLDAAGPLGAETVAVYLLR